MKVRAYKMYQVPGNQVTNLLDSSHTNCDPGEVKLIEIETLCGTLSLIDLIDKETSLVTLSKKLGQGFSENNETYEVPEKVMKSFEGLTQQNQLNVVVFCVSPHFVDMKKSIEMLSLAKNLVKLPNFVKRNKVVVTNKTKGLVSTSRKLKGSMCTFWTKKTTTY
uniref:Uncharacterized protein n=1 Tax=Solanum tuberosum TaxID=4113 RepID=M1DJE2_SOLTU